ncbi:GNAT family N-acetyltransferase [Streptomyces laurentii]|uniref:GNAT family N-acetyltransferase n=1 Tax=Streptomyces laurentii TaxID=39478 RepID=UPI0036BC105E
MILFPGPGQPNSSEPQRVPGNGTARLVGGHEGLQQVPLRRGERPGRVVTVRDNRDDFLILLPDGTPVGHVALTCQNIVNGTAEVELMLAAPHRGHRHGTAALDAVVDLAFGELPMYRLTAETHTDNFPALAALATSGFTQEGISRAACLHRGRRLDLAVFSLLRPEWEELNRPRAWDA